MIVRKVLLVCLAFVLCFPVLTYAADKPQGQPFQFLQQQVDSLKEQLGNLPKFTPPTITSTLTCVSSLSMIINLSITDEKEIAYYAIQQQGGNPPINIIVFVEPGVSGANYELTVESGSEARTLLFIASDTEGNVGKSMLEIKPNVCLNPCPDEVVCP